MVDNLYINKNFWKTREYGTVLDVRNAVRNDHECEMLLFDRIPFCEMIDRLSGLTLRDFLHTQCEQHPRHCVLNPYANHPGCQR